MEENHYDGLLKDHKLPFKVMIKRTMNYVLPEWKSFVISLLFILCNVAVDVTGPLLISKLTDNLKDSAKISINLILIVAIGYLILCIIGQGIRYLESMILTKAGQRIVYKAPRRSVFSR